MAWLRRRGPDESPAATYAQQRRELLTADASDAGAAGGVARVVMETNYRNRVGNAGSLTVAAFADGTARACHSSGAAWAGSGRHMALEVSVQQLLRVARDVFAVIPPSAQAPSAPPAPGRVVLCVMAAGAVHAGELAEAELGGGAHELSALFYAAHGVFADLRREWLADHDGRDVADDYGPPRWTQREVESLDETPMAADAVFAALARDGVSQAVVAFSGGNDEGGADTITFVRDGVPPAEQDMWRDGRQDFAEALSAPIYEQVGTFAGGFVIHGTLTWEVPERRLTLRDARAGEGECDCDMYGEPVDPREN